MNDTQPVPPVSTPISQPQVLNTPPKSKIPLILGVIALLAVCAGGYVFYTKKSAPVVPVAVIPEASKEIVLGYNAAMSKNGVANFGIAGRIGFELAVKEINDKGGILGKKIRPVILDDEGDKELSKKNAQQLIFQDKASAIVGPANSGNALNWMDIAEDNDVIVFTPIATASGLTTKYAERLRNYIFRISSFDMEQMRQLMSWAIWKTNNGKIAIIHDTTGYGVQGEKDVAEVLSRWGKTPVLIESFTKASTTAEMYVSMLKDAQKAGADAIMLYMLSDSSAELVKASTKIPGFKPIFLGTAANTIDLWQLAGPASTNLYFSTAVVVDDTTPAGMKFAADATKIAGTSSPQLGTTANAYDIVYFLKAAFEKAGSTDKKAVRDALESIDDLQGAIRHYSKPFSKDDHEGLSAKDFVVTHWVGGKLVELTDEVKDLEIK